jgi:hypothetical protein
MATKLTILTYKIAIQLHLVAESCTVCSYRYGRPVRELLGTSSYMEVSGQIHAPAALPPGKKNDINTRIEG